MYHFGAPTNHTGVAIAVHKKLNGYVTTYRTVNDRIGTVTLKTGSHTMEIVVAYAPTLKRSEDKKHTVRADFYNALHAAVDRVPRSHALYILGDFNAKTGRAVIRDGRIETDLCENMGRHGKGHRNSNGVALLEFAEDRDLFLSNTAFEHKAGSTATWRSMTRPMKKDGSGTYVVFNQIDYILCRRKHKGALKDARSHQKTTLKSDHRLVTATLWDIGRMWRRQNRKKPERKPRVNLAALKDTTTRDSYRTRIADSLTDAPRDTWLDTSELLKSTAKEICGMEAQKKRDTAHWVTDEVVQTLSLQQKRLRGRIEAQKWPQKRKILKHLRNEVMRLMKHRIREVWREKIDRMAQELEDTRSDARRHHMVVRRLRRRKAKRGVFVHNENGEMAVRDEDKLKYIKKHFAKTFGEEIPPTVHATSAGPLDNPITALEVWRAHHRLNNGRMAGLDQVAGELMKYACVEQLTIEHDDQTLDELAEQDTYCCTVRDILNGYFEDGVAEPFIGAGHLLALQKPGKPKGPEKSLRPITVLNTIRKILSTIALRRAEGAGVNNYIPQTQHAFRKGKSTADVVFAHRILSNVVENAKYWKYYTLSIDMSAAFDTPTRRGLLLAMRAATNDNNDVRRMTAMLLTNTTLKINVGDAECDPFVSTVGTPQGDSFSPVMFNAYAEYVLRQIRPLYGAPPEDDVKSCLPTEATYADDTDLLSTDLAHLQTICAILETELPKHQLMMNAKKTEWCTIERERDGEARHEWRKRKILGNKAGCREDLAYRCAQGGVAFRSIYPILINTHVRLQDRVRLYKCYVESVVLYNVGCLGLSKGNWRKLNAKQRRHIRRIAGVRWPNKMSNDALTTLVRIVPWSYTAAMRRWTLFGHILRADKETPAAKALLIAARATVWERRIGRPSRGLWTQLTHDYRLITSATAEIYEETLFWLRDEARQRKVWIAKCEKIARAFQIDLES
jgi:hypothetical protein